MYLSKKEEKYDKNGLIYTNQQISPIFCANIAKTGFNSKRGKYESHFDYVLNEYKKYSILENKQNYEANNFNESGCFSLPFSQIITGRIDYKYRRFNYDNPNYLNQGKTPIGECITEFKKNIKFDENLEYEYYGSSTDAVDENGNFINSVTISGKNPPSRAKQELTEGTIVITNLEGNRGMPAIVTEDVAGSVLSSAFIVIKPNENIDINYLKLSLYSTYVQDYLRKVCSTGLNSAQACWSIEDLNKIKINLPTIEEQQSTMEKVDEKIQIINTKKAEYLAKIQVLDDLIKNDTNKFITSGFSDDLFEIPKEGDE